MLSNNSIFITKEALCLITRDILTNFVGQMLISNLNKNVVFSVKLKPAVAYEVMNKPNPFHMVNHPLKNGKCVPCFCRGRETLLEVLENKK